MSRKLRFSSLFYIDSTENIDLIGLVDLATKKQTNQELNIKDKD